MMLELILLVRLVILRIGMLFLTLLIEIILFPPNWEAVGSTGGLTVEMLEIMLLHIMQMFLKLLLGLFLVMLFFQLMI